ncbi:MAG: hypothetical protein KF708_21145 [Pirellulales bacterium]|nr:hypothetical protein [Pirellulales bacterium]
MNRYDHVIMAGAALGALGANLPEYEHWKCTFFDHLDKAYKLHHIHDVYILEHRDCGAYRDFLQEAGDFDEGQEKAEFACHRKYANQLRREILAWAKERDIKLRVRAFLMDLRGRVAQLEEPRQNRKPKRKRAES